jgi:S-adenosylmethionine-diacylglycerol 3-amino-3-carboxypropyl transferase
MVRNVSRKRVARNVQDLIFRQIHGNRLIYNACWEDPRLDRLLLELDDTSQVVMITSAGCNALDYLLDSPAEIHSIDVNPRQNALLQLKLALIRWGDYQDLFAMFGLGVHRTYKKLYRSIRPELPTYARAFWDDKIYYFNSKKLKKSFYYHATSGDIAWLIQQYLRAHRSLRDHLRDLIEANSLAEQQAIYERIEPKLWNDFSRWLVKHPLVMAMLGVPRAQMQIVDMHHPDGVAGHVRDNLKRVATQVFIGDNYFWRVYITGCYTHTCCPNYLKEDHFAQLRANLDRIQTYNCTLTDFLERHPGPYTHFILLDHQDWLATYKPEALQEEWRLILQRSRPGSKILMRTAGLDVDYLPSNARTSLRFFPEKTQALHPQDRVGTYGSMHLAEVQ